MPKVIADIAMSLDGYVRGRGADRRVGVRWVADDGELGGKDKAVAAAGEHLTENLLAGAAAVVDRGVDDVAASFGIGVDHPSALVEGRADTSLFAEGHRPQEDLRDAQAGATEELVRACSRVTAVLGER